MHCLAVNIDKVIALLHLSLISSQLPDRLRIDFPLADFFFNFNVISTTWEGRGTTREMHKPSPYNRWSRWRSSVNARFGSVFNCGLIEFDGEHHRSVDLRPTWTPISAQLVFRTERHLCFFFFSESRDFEREHLSSYFFCYGGGAVAWMQKRGRPEHDGTQWLKVLLVLQFDFRPR